MYPANQAFGAWCVIEGFDMDARVRSNAMWLAEHWDSSSHGWKTDMTHPSRIRSEHRDLQVVPPPSPDLDLSEAAPLDPSIGLIAAIAPIKDKVNKLDSVPGAASRQPQKNSGFSGWK